MSMNRKCPNQAAQTHALKWTFIVHKMHRGPFCALRFILFINDIFVTENHLLLEPEMHVHKNGDLDLDKIQLVLNVSRGASLC